MLQEAKNMAKNKNNKKSQSLFTRFPFMAKLKEE